MCTINFISSSVIAEKVYKAIYKERGLCSNGTIKVADNYRIKYDGFFDAWDIDKYDGSMCLCNIHFEVKNGARYVEVGNAQVKEHCDRANYGDIFSILYSKATEAIQSLYDKENKQIVEDEALIAETNKAIKAEKVAEELPALPEVIYMPTDDQYNKAARCIAGAFDLADSTMTTFYSNSNESYMHSVMAVIMGVDIEVLPKDCIDYDRLWDEALDNYMESHAEEVIDEVIDELSTDPYILTYLETKKEEQGEDFNLEYEVGSYIACGLVPEGYDDDIAKAVAKYHWTLNDEGLSWEEVAEEEVAC